MQAFRDLFVLVAVELLPDLKTFLSHFNRLPGLSLDARELS